MTMDVASQNQTDLKMPCSASDNCMKRTEFTAANTKQKLKRSFDVAFLMMPDDRIKHKQHRTPDIYNQQCSEMIHPCDLSPKQITASTRNVSPAEFISIGDVRHHVNSPIRSPRIYDDPTILPEPENVVRSAFTKVLQARLESPIPPLSPDQLSCPSTSPPLSTPPPRHNMMYRTFRPEYSFNGYHPGISPSSGPPPVLTTQNNRMKQHLMYRQVAPGSSDLIPGYIQSPSFPFGNPIHSFIAHQPDLPGIVRNPAAAALLSTLIPPTIATTFSLTAQNVCAKCNISFRMTSDLVYHMRSHHRTEVQNDPNRRKREDKLKCPVCSESFRERHHLTRHMTAHQDKESDQANNSGIDKNQTRPK